MEKTSIGLQENVASLLCYAGGWVTGVIFIMLEPSNRTVRLHAFQSVIVFATLNLAYFVFWFVPVFGWMVNWLILAAAFIFGVVSTVWAYQGQKWKLPVIGSLAEKWANR